MKVAVIGSGFAAWGAVVALAARNDLQIEVLDIGLTGGQGQNAARTVPNAKPTNGSYYCYGVNDAAAPIAIQSERICSSHALGGHSTVYSGAMLYPPDYDLIDWPAGSMPREIDYAAVLARLPLLYEPSGLDTLFPVVPTQAALSAERPRGGEASLVGASRVAAKAGTPGTAESVRPFCLVEEFEAMASAGILRYRDRCYVSQVASQAGEVRVSYSRDGTDADESYDAVFLGAGCVNTTAIVDRSLGGSGTREYRIRMPLAAIHAFIRFPFPIGAAARLRRASNLPEIFLEVYDATTDHAWAHTQLTPLNDQIIDAVCGRFPRWLHPAIRGCRAVFYFALSAQTARNRDAALVRSTLNPSEPHKPPQTIAVSEFPAPRTPQLIQAVRRAVLRHWRDLRMIPLPFGEQLADFFRRNRLGGWHFGSTLPMRDRPSGPAECLPSGELAGLRGVFVVDSAAFPSIPSQTIALLTAANAHRVARAWSAGRTTRIR